jgi:copper chaperone CopZ
VLDAGVRHRGPGAPRGIANLVVSQARHHGRDQQARRRTAQETTRENPMMNATPRTFVGITSFLIRGTTGGHGEDAVVSSVSRLDGVQSVTVDATSGLVTIAVDRPTDRAEIAAAIDGAGYTLVP